MAKVSIKAAVRDAKREDVKQRKEGIVGAATFDSFVNLALKLGMGADNAMSNSSYGFNPITRNRTLLEWVHRGSWLGGLAVDIPADDMTRAGVEQLTTLDPDDQERIDRIVTALALWTKIGEVIKWGRLYGGGIGVALIDGQDTKTPLNPDTVGPGGFRGILPLDRWMVEPSLEDLVTEFGPALGQPRYYRVLSNAPALRGQIIHYSRVPFRFEGICLPYNQRLTENLWGVSIIERLYDRMVAFDSATTGSAQLVYKSYLRTLKIPGLRDIVAAGGQPMNGLLTFVNFMSRFQGQEGITLLDKEDEFDIQQPTASFTGIDSALNQFGQQISGALQIPLVRLFGQSPAGLNSSGDSDLRTYYDGIAKDQARDLKTGVTLVYKLIAKSLGIDLPNNFEVKFISLWQMQPVEKAELAGKVSESVSKAYEAGLIGRQTALKELRQSSHATGIFTNISDETIDAADDEVAPPGVEGMEGADQFGTPPPNAQGDQNDEIRSQGSPGTVPHGTRRRVELPHPAAPDSPAD